MTYVSIIKIGQINNGDVLICSTNLLLAKSPVGRSNSNSNNSLLLLLNEIQNTECSGVLNYSDQYDTSALTAAPGIR